MNVTTKTATLEDLRTDYFNAIAYSDRLQVELEQQEDLADRLAIQADQALRVLPEMSAEYTQQLELEEELRLRWLEAKSR